MRVAVLGGDGFVGWPTALHLSARGHEVAILDNLSRRTIDAELGVQSLTPIATIQDRVETWHAATGRRLEFALVDVARDYHGLRDWLAGWRPDAVVHFAEQRAAPYSMKSPRHKRYTVENNTGATHNLLCALVELGLDAHLVHLGTMGVYGYGTVGAAIPEGYLDVGVTTDDGREARQEILYPANPGSVYHMTKCLDQLLFAYYAKNDRLRITDLHQGIVWGTTTPETALDERLVNRFDYDGDYGTVLNRFLVQAAIGYPLSIHGTGGQTRAFIHIRDSVRCVEIALQSPPRRGERVKIFNQMTETHRLRDLAAIVRSLTGAEVAQVANPRNEAPENELVVRNEQFLALGLQPTTLAEGLLDEVVEVARRHADRIDRRRIPCVSAWTSEIATRLRAAPAAPAITSRRKDEHAYVTLVTSEGYGLGALALARSLRRVGAEAPLVVMAPEGAGHLEELASEGCLIVPTEVPELSDAFHERHAREAVHRAAPFTKGLKPGFHEPLLNFCKLRLWQLEDYRRVVFLDADTIALQNPDRLFRYPGFTAAPNLYETEDDFHRLNSGVFVADPDSAVYARMMQALDRPDAFWRRTDQTFLEHFYPDWHGLPYTWNVMQYVFFNLPRLWRWQEIKVLHYQYEKPWMDEHPRREQLGPLIDLWWRVFEGRELPASIDPPRSARAA